FSQPRRSMLPAWTAKTLAKQLLKPPRRRAQENAHAASPQLDANQWPLSAYDSALLSNPEGTHLAWYKRHPPPVRDVPPHAIGAHVELHRRWPQLQRSLQDAVERIAAFEEWERTFAAHPAPVRDRDRAEQVGPSSGGPAA